MPPDEVAQATPAVSSGDRDPGAPCPIAERCVRRTSRIPSPGRDPGAAAGRTRQSAPPALTRRPLSCVGAGVGGCPGQVLDDAAILHYVGISHDDNRHRTSAGLKHLAVPATSGQKGALQTQIVILEKWRRPPPR
jgi:hypothetical protein